MDPQFSKTNKDVFELGFGKRLEDVLLIVGNAESYLLQVPETSSSIKNVQK